MNQYTFRTNINCSGCVAKIGPVLDQNEGINEWMVDTGQADKVLTVKTDILDEESIREIVHKAGFKAEKLD
jgi:copper chaperone